LVKLRLKRIGKKKKPVYKIVAADARSPRDGRFIEEVGSYDPNFDPMKIVLKKTKVTYWLKNGAQPTDTVRQLLQKEGVLLQMNLSKRGKSQDEIDARLTQFDADKIAKLERAKAKKVRLKERQKAKKAQTEEKKES
jgi:small subunit ribosomal protein S16